MNRTLAFGLVAVALICLVLYLVVPMSDGLNTGAEILVVLVSLAVVIHMFIDRRLSIWNASSVSIMLGEIGWLVLFGFFAFRAIFGRGSLTPGESEFWLDLVLALVLLSRPLLLESLIAFRMEKRRTGEPAIPGELLSPPTWPEVERRSGVDRRRTTAEIYDRRIDS